ncbi:MAG: alpha-amylase [Candidatus Eremiobacteraeota bacterium]|nr:alpha-amylase [Candidatus Eremiobacteraeota bacterium]
MIYPEDKLKQLSFNCGDLKGAAAAPWMKEMVLYEIYVRDISPEGTFKGVIPLLDDIKELGATAIWLMPIHPIGELNRKGSLGCPYSSRDFMDVDPQLGTGEDFKLLVEETHSRGMRFFIDMVANHTAHDNVNVKTHPKWFYIDEQGNPAGRHMDWSDVIDNNYNNPELWNYMKNAILYWVREFDVDGYRCDVAGMVPLEFWEETIGELRKIKPDVYMLAEWENPYLCVNAFNSDYHSELYRQMVQVKQGNARAIDLLELVISNKQIYPRNYLPLNFIENHDQKRASKVFGEMGYRPYAAFVFTIPGIPLVYNGQEIGKTEYLSLFEKQPIDWKDKNLCTLEFYKGLIKLRKENPVFREGEIIPLIDDNPDHTLTYLLKSKNDTVGVFLNLTAEKLKLNVKFPSFINYRPREIIFPSLLQEDTPRINDGVMTFNMRENGVVIMR